MSASKIIVLTGGLGNQLFQLAAGLFVASPDQLFLEEKLGRPRVNIFKKATIDSFEFPFKLNFLSKPNSGWLGGYLTLILFKIASKSFYSKTFQYFWLWLKSQAISAGIFISDGVGFDPRLKAGSDVKWIYGPFHCYRYLSSPGVKEEMKLMRPKIYPEWLTHLKEVSSTEQPIVLHVRLSDYKFIPELGILTNSYYRKSLTMALNAFPFSRIWLFTDEENLALDLLEDLGCEDVRIINYDPSDAAANLEAMRFGHCFVLSNSTFSWWGASLAYSPSSKIFCPENWFKTKENPRDLIPRSWIRVENSDFS